MNRWLATVLMWAAGAAAYAGPIPPPVKDAWPFPLEKLFGAPVQTPHPAVVRVVVQERSGLSLGSGALVAVQGAYGLVVTNWHVVREAAGPITVIFPDGFRSGATVLKVDPEWDLAALAIWRPQASPIPLAAEMPQLGESLTIVGYGSGQYRAATGRCLQYLSPGQNQPPEMIELSVGARQGDSGGPILNTQGQLAGVLFGASWGRTAGSSCRRVQTFLASLTPWFGLQDANSLAAGQPPAGAPAYSWESAGGAGWRLAQLPGGHIPAGISSFPADRTPNTPSPTPGDFSSGTPLARPMGQAPLPSAAIPGYSSPQNTGVVGSAVSSPGADSRLSEDLASTAPQVHSLPATPPGNYSSAGPNAASADPAGQPFSRFEAVKNFLAFVGAVALLLLAVRVVSGSPVE